MFDYRTTFSSKDGFEGPNISLQHRYQAVAEPLSTPLPTHWVILHHCALSARSDQNQSASADDFSPWPVGPLLESAKVALYF